MVTFSRRRRMDPEEPFAIGLIGFIVFFIVLVTGAMVANVVLNNPGRSEARATENAQRWVMKAGEVSRLTCAHDSDGDGYGSCTAVLKSGEKVYLQCVAGWWQAFTGATGCKEVETAIHFNRGGLK